MGKRSGSIPMRSRWMKRAAALTALGAFTCGATVALADITMPREMVKKTVDDAKNQAKDAKNGPKKELEEQKKHAKNAVDEALDGGLASDAGADAGDAGAGEAGADAGDAGDPVADDVRETVEWAKSRAERASHTRETIRRELGNVGGPPMDDAIREELKLHGRRVAYLDRIGWFANRTGDLTSKVLVKKLLDDEFARHAAWLGDHASGRSRP